VVKLIYSGIVGFGISGSCYLLTSGQDHPDQKGPSDTSGNYDDFQSAKLRFGEFSRHRNGSKLNESKSFRENVEK